MAKISLSPNALGTGTFTIASPNGNTDRTITLPDVTGTVQVSGAPISGTTASFSGNVTLGSSVLATPTGSAPSYTCRAWVNFDGTGTVAIRASGNVSSITDNGVGDYTANFGTAMPDVNYGIAGFCRQPTDSIAWGAACPTMVNGGSGEVLTTSCRVRIGSRANGAASDTNLVCLSFFR